MKWAEISIAIAHDLHEAVAELFHELGASGVIIEDPELVNSYRRSGIWDYCDIPEQFDLDNVVVKAYLPVDSQLDGRLRHFEEQVSGLLKDNSQPMIKWREVQDEDWATAWKSFYHPIKVGEQIVIKPTWEHYQPLEGEVVVEIDPGMAFGTGTHHTTVLCIRCLEELVKPGCVVIDVGTGSGVLAITAAKLGAASVIAVDSDSVAIVAAKDNAAQNEVASIVQVQTGDLLHGITTTADLIVANIVADVIIRMLPNVRTTLSATGCLCASGIISERVADVTAAMLKHGLIIDKVLEEGSWAAIVACQGSAE